MSKDNGGKRRIEIRARTLHEKAGLDMKQARGIARGEIYAQQAFMRGDSPYTEYRCWCPTCKIWQTYHILPGLTIYLYCRGCGGYIPLDWKTTWERRQELHKKIRQLKLNMVQDGLIIIALISLVILILREMLK